MRSGDPWKLRGFRREVQESAREAARRAGMSVGEWLDSVISAEQDRPETRRGTRDYPEYDLAGGHEEEPRGRDSYGGEADEQRRASSGDNDPAANDRTVRALNARLDDLSRQLTQVAQLTEATVARAAAREQE